MRDLIRLAALLRPYRRWVAFGIFLSLFTVLANVGLLALSSWFIASMAIAGASGGIMNYTLPAAGVRALALGRTGGRYAERLVNHDTTFKVLARLRLWLFERLEPLAPARLVSFRGGDLLSRLRADVDTLDEFYVRGVMPLLVAILSVTAIVLFLSRFSARVALTDLLFLLAAGIGIPTAISALGARPGKRLVDTAAALRSGIVSHAEGMAELVAFGAVDEHEQELVRLGTEYESDHVVMSRITGLTDSSMILLMSLAMWTTLIVAVPLVRQGAADGPTLAMLIAFALGSFESVMPLPDVARRLGEIRTAARRLYELIDAEPEVLDRGAAVPARGAPDVSFDNLTFRYADDANPALESFSIEVPAGRKIAIVGPTGAGKSSIANILFRFWDFDNGTVRANGTDLREFGLEAARELVSAAPQRPHLFHASLRENLLLGRPDATDDEIHAAAKAAQIDELISSLPDRLETEVGEAGRTFSTGQIQRIAIARALLKEAPVLVLDEPTEGLDGPTAERLIRSVFDHASGRTVLLITHLLFGLDFVDEVVVLNRGRIVARGEPGSVELEPHLNGHLRPLGNA